MQITPDQISLEHVRSETRHVTRGYDGRPTEYPIHIYRVYVASPDPIHVTGEREQAPAIVRQYAAPHGSWWRATAFDLDEAEQLAYYEAPAEGETLAEAPSYASLAAGLADQLTRAAEPYAVSVDFGRYDYMTDETTEYTRTVTGAGWYSPGQIAADALERERARLGEDFDVEINDVYSPQY